MKEKDGKNGKKKRKKISFFPSSSQSPATLAPRLSLSFSLSLRFFSASSRERVETTERQSLKKTKSERTMASRPMLSLALLLFVASFSPVVLAKRGALRYEEGDSVILYANKVGPFKNPRCEVLPLRRSGERGRGGGCAEAGRRRSFGATEIILFRKSRSSLTDETHSNRLLFIGGFLPPSSLEYNPRRSKGTSSCVSAT